MPLFTRRRMQAMLDELASHMDNDKLSDLCKRLENKRPEQALPAEIELSVLWALSKLGEIDVEPHWFGSRRADVYTESLFLDQPCAVEITAISDARLSQEDEMRRISSQLVEFANTVRKRSGKHLFFAFQVENDRGNSGLLRRRKIDTNFALSGDSKETIKAWLGHAEEVGPLDLRQGKTHIVVTWHAAQRSQFTNFFCTMPAEAYSLVDNPLFDALDEKRKQLRIPGFEGLRCIAVADAGCRMLRDLDPFLRTTHVVSGKQVITHFLLEAAGAVDAVIVLSPHRKHSPYQSPMDHRKWVGKLFCRPGLALPDAGFQTMLSLLPLPRFEGYQARSLHQQAAYQRDAHGWYVQTSSKGNGDQMTIRISARAVMELMAGKITLEQFQHFTSISAPDRPNLFAHRLKHGDILANAVIEPGGIDQDDDWLVFQLKNDPAAAPLQITGGNSEAQ